MLFRKYISKGTHFVYFLFVLSLFNEGVSLLLDEQNVEMQIHRDVVESSHFTFANDISEWEKNNKKENTHNIFFCFSLQISKYVTRANS